MEKHLDTLRSMYLQIYRKPPFDNTDQGLVKISECIDGKIHTRDKSYEIADILHSAEVQNQHSKTSQTYRCMKAIRDFYVKPTRENQETLLERLDEHPDKSWKPVLENWHKYVPVLNEFRNKEHLENFNHALNEEEPHKSYLLSHIAKEILNNEYVKEIHDYVIDKMAEYQSISKISTSQTAPQQEARAPQ